MSRQAEIQELERQLEGCRKEKATAVAEYKRTGALICLLGAGDWHVEQMLIRNRIEQVECLPKIMSAPAG